MAADQADRQWQALEAACAESSPTREWVWMQAFSLGCDVGLMELDAFLCGVVALPAAQRDIFAHAANECLDETQSSVRVPYSWSGTEVASDDTAEGQR